MASVLRFLSRSMAGGLASLALASPVDAQQDAAGAARSRPASDATKAANALVANSLPFSDRQDFEDALRGFIARPDALALRHPDGKPISLTAIQTGRLSVGDAVASGKLEFEGRREAFGEFMGLLDPFPFWFNVVTP